MGARYATAERSAVSVRPIFFFNDTATTEIYTLSLHDALPISALTFGRRFGGPPRPRRGGASPRSEEHTSELQSRLHLVCRLLLEKKHTPYITQRNSFRTLLLSTRPAPHRQP